MEKKIEFLFENWRKRNIEGFFCQNREEAIKKILGFIPLEASFGVSGSKTLDQLGIAKKLEERGNTFFNQYKPGLSNLQNLSIRRQGANADYYLASANAVSFNGELVFISAFGNRIAGISYAKQVIIVCGINKLTNDVDSGLKRAREYVTPLNCKRLNWNTPCFKDGVCSKEICLFSEYKRMCCQILIIEAEITPGRMKMILVDEELGY